MRLGAAPSEVIPSAGIVEFPKWVSEIKSLSAYKLHVESRLVARSLWKWGETPAKHTAQVPYTQVCPRRGGYLNKCLSASLDWGTLLGSRSHCRLRAGLILLRSRRGKRSLARYQDCIFCSTCTRNATVHVLGQYKVWAPLRSSFVASSRLDVAPISADRLTREVLRIEPGTAGFKEAVQWAVQVDRAARAFWQD